MNSPAVPERGHLRASDADRERVAEILRQAAGEGRLTIEELHERLDAVYAAKTYADLEPVTRDLPGDANLSGPAPSRVPARATLDPARFGGEPTMTSAIAIMGGAVRKGDWVVPRQFTAFSIMGGIEIDMRDARFSEQTVTIHAVTIMGGIEVTVPDDATVRVTGIGIMGGFDHAASDTGRPGAPTIIIDGVALMGGVDIRRKPSRASRARLRSQRPASPGSPPPVRVPGPPPPVRVPGPPALVRAPWFASPGPPAPARLPWPACPGEFALTLSCATAVTPAPETSTASPHCMLGSLCIPNRL